MLKKEIRKEVNKKIRVKKSVQIRAFALANPYHPCAIFQDQFPALLSKIFPEFIFLSGIKRASSGRFFIATKNINS